ncbi:MAG: hypothetical protein R3F36_14260 [Candidatus Competibacteraceae bacterium]
MSGTTGSNWNSKASSWRLSSRARWNTSWSRTPGPESRHGRGDDQTDVAILDIPVRAVIVTDDQGVDLYRIPEVDPRSARRDGRILLNTSEETARFSAPSSSDP